MENLSWRWVGICVLGFAVAALCHAEGYVLDRYVVKTTEVAEGSTLLIGDFSTENADFGKVKKEAQKETAAMMKRAAPSALAMTRADGWTANLPGRDDVRRLLVLKWSALGDVVIATAAFEDIRAAFPGREIHLNTTPRWEALFRDDPRFDRVVAIDVRDPRRRMARNAQWIAAIRAGRDVAILTTRSIGMPSMRNLLIVVGRS